MDRLDQGHLHPKLEVLRLTSLGWETNLGFTLGGERSSKELLEQHIDSYSFGTSTLCVHMRPRQLFIIIKFAKFHHIPYCKVILA
jgi:hypothetical protein